MTHPSAQPCGGGVAVKFLVQTRLERLQGQSRLCSALPWTSCRGAAAVAITVLSNSCFLQTCPQVSAPLCSAGGQGQQDASESTAPGAVPHRKPALPQLELSQPGECRRSCRTENKAEGREGAVFRGPKQCQVCQRRAKNLTMDFTRDAEHLRGVLQQCFLTCTLCFRIQTPNELLFVLRGILRR